MRILEIGFKKIAVYVTSTGTPTHGARQANDGRWLSKLGSCHDIAHESLNGLFCDEYGYSIGLIMKKSVEPVHV